MANSHTLGSFTVSLSASEASFAQGVIELLENENYDILGDAPADIDLSTWEFAQQLAEQLGDEYEDHEVRFSCEAKEDAKTHHILISHNNCESINFDGAVIFTQMLLERFNIDEPVLAECAFTCEKARPGEFGGGAAFITKSGIKWHGTAAWLRDALNDYEQEKSGNPKQITLTEHAQLNVTLFDEESEVNSIKAQITYSPVAGITISVDGYTDATNTEGGEVIIADYFGGNFDVRVYGDNTIAEPTHHITFEEAKIRK